MKKPNELLKKEDNSRFEMRTDVKIDNRNREEVFEVVKHGVTLEWTANITEALGAFKQSMDSKIYSINMRTGIRTLRHA